MTQEQKDLLLKDLCARLPYGIKGIITYDKSNTTFTVEGIDNNILHLSDAEECYVEDFKPYLRLMSSMTEKEKKDFLHLINWDENDLTDIIKYPHMYEFTISIKAFDWLNKNHFDYRGLIPMGLAIEAPKDMYKL